LQVGTRALEILIALTERVGELVTKDELIARAWSNATVEESNLRVQVALLRKVLGDTQTVPRYIAAVPGRGYRFVAPISYSVAREAAATDALNNLPRQLTQPIGRAEAIKAVRGRFHRFRLTTIVGPGGIGKTTLCLTIADQLASSYEHGVCFLDLAPLANAQLVPSVLASALGLADISSDPLPGVVAHLRDRRMLLVFDSCELVIDTAARLAETLLKQAPGIHILATSRESLRAEEESVYRLAPLDMPPVTAGLTAAEALAFPAVQLFVDRATSSSSEFEFDDKDALIVADICRQLDGIALAIELAAARVEAFGTRGVAELLYDRFRLLTGGRRTALPRHQTLAATLDWSYEALSDTEQTVLRSLSVFAGEFTLDAAIAVMSDAHESGMDIPDLLAKLIAKSLVSADAQTNVARYRLLDTTRAYLLAKLAQRHEFDGLVRRVADYLCRILKQSYGEIETLSGDEWLSRYGRHINNVRMVLDWAFSPRGDPEVGLVITVAAIPLWFQLSSVDECRDGVQRALASALPGASQDAQARHVMQLYKGLGQSRVFTNGLVPQASTAYAKALELAEQLQDVEEQLEALWGLWFCQIGMGQYRAALGTANRFCGIAKSSADLFLGDQLVSAPLYFMGDHTSVRYRVERMIAQNALPPIDPVGAIRFRADQAVASRVLLAKILWLQGFPDQAIRVAQSSVEERPVASHAISLCDALSRGVCPVALFVGDLAMAERSIATLLDHAAKHALAPWEIFGRSWKGALCIRKGDFARGLPLLRTALAQLQEGGLFTLYGAQFLGILAEGLASAGQIGDALTTIDEAISHCEQKEELWCIAELVRVKGEILWQEGADAQAAEQCFLRSIEWARQQEALSWELRAAMSLARLRRDRDEVTPARDLLAAVYGRFSEGFVTADLQTAKALLDELS
jgi:predicted ATPase/DNA-binding winged helix-turn-helix (wHTH) protein